MIGCVVHRLRCLVDWRAAAHDEWVRRGAARMLDESMARTVAVADTVAVAPDRVEPLDGEAVPPPPRTRTVPRETLVRRFDPCGET